MSVNQAAGFSLKGAIRNSGRVFYKNALGRRLSQAGAEKAIELRIGPLVPMIATAAALLYHQGMQETSPHGDPGSWKRMLAESALGTLVIENTKGIYPIWGGLLSAYRAGQKQKALDKIHAVVNTVTTLITGFMGVHLFAGFSEMANEIEDKDIHRYLDRPGMKGWANHLAASPDAEVSGLGQALNTLRQRIAVHHAMIGQGSHSDWDGMKAVSSEISELKAEVASKFATLEEKAVKPLGFEKAKVYEAFREALAGSQDSYIRLVRSMNPFFGYIIVGLMAGTAIASFANKKIDAYLKQRFPNIDKMKFRQLFDKDVTLMPPQPAAAHGASGGHGAGGGHDYITSPTLCWPEIGYNGGHLS